MGVDVMSERLLPLRRQPGGKGAAERICRGRPGSRAVRRLRRGLDHGRSRDRDRESAEHANEGRTDDKAAYSHERFLDPVPRLVKWMSSAAAP